MQALDLCPSTSSSSPPLPSSSASAAAVAAPWASTQQRCSRVRVFSSRLHDRVSVGCSRSKSLWIISTAGSAAAFVIFFWCLAFLGSALLPCVRGMRETELGGKGGGGDAVEIDLVVRKKGGGRKRLKSDGDGCAI